MSTSRAVGRCRWARRLSTLPSPPGDFDLSAGPLSVDFSTLLSDLAGPALSLPSGFPTLALTGGQVSISKQDGDYKFDLQGKAGSYGSLDLEVLSGPKAAAAFVLPSGWSLSELHGLSSFSALDVSNAGLVLSSFTDSDFSFPDTAVANNVQGVQEGAEFFASLELSGGALGVVGKVLKVDSAGVSGLIAADPSATELTAKATTDIDIVPGVPLSDVTVALKADPPSVTLQATSVVKIEGESLTFDVDTTVSADDVSVALDLGSRWTSPFGIRGLTIETVVLSIDVEPVFAVGIYGEIDFGNKDSAKVGAQFVEGDTPDFLEAELDGPVTLSQVIKTFTSVTPPSVLSNVSISSFKIYVVANPAGVTIGGLFFPAGFAFHGAIDFFGFSVTASVNVSETRLRASGSMSPIHVGSLFDLTAAPAKPGDTATSGPSFSLDTDPEPGSPIVAISAKAKLMGLSASVSGEVTDKGFKFELTESLNAALGSNSVSASFDLAATLDQGTSFSASGTIHFALNVDLGPISIPDTTIKVGPTIHLDTTLKGSMSVSVDPTGDPTFSLTFGATLTWGKDASGKAATFTVPQETLKVSFSSLDQLPGKILSHLEKKAWDVFSSVLDDAGKTLEQAGKDLEKTGKKLITLGDNFGKALKEKYKKTDKQAATLLKQAGWTATQVSGALVNGWSVGASDAAKVLAGADYTAKQVGDVLNNTFKLTASQASSALKGAQYDANQVSQALQGAYVGLGSAVANSLAGIESGVGQEAKNIATGAVSIGKKLLGDVRIHLP